MKQILVLGAGQSTSYLISRLLDEAERENWFVTVGDADVDAARRHVGRHPRGDAVRFEVNDSALRSTAIAKADAVVNLLPAVYQALVAGECVRHRRHMLSASYRDQAVRELHPDAQRNGVLLLSEMGLDPGIDHMSAMSLIRRIEGEGGRIVGFRSYGGGIPAPDQPQNPLRYVVTWNARNVVMAGCEGAQYMQNGEIKLVPYHQVFRQTWPVEVEGIGRLEAYANRDSLSYKASFGLEEVRTMIRGTLRYPGWSETWAHVVHLGLPNEALRIPGLAERSYREIVEMFLPSGVSGASLEQRVSRFLGISATGRIMENLRWLGLFSEERIGCQGDTAAQMMVHLMRSKLALTADLRDLVLLVHELEVDYPGTDRRPEQVTSTLRVEGQAGGFTAMATTVGLPLVIAARMLLRDELPLTGSFIPTHPSIYGPVLREIEEAGGLRFTERVAPRT